MEQQARLKEDEAKAALREALDAKAEAEATKIEIQQRANDKEAEADEARKAAQQAQDEAEDAKRTLENLMVEIEDDVGKARKEAVDAREEAEKAKTKAIEEAEKARQAKSEAEREVERVRDRLTRLIETDWMINNPTPQASPATPAPQVNNTNAGTNRQTRKNTTEEDQFEDVTLPEVQEEETIIQEIAPAASPEASKNTKKESLDDLDIDFNEDMTGGFSSSIPLDDLLESQRLSRAAKEREEARGSDVDANKEDTMQTKDLPTAPKENETLYPIYHEEVARKNIAQKERERRFRNFQDRARTIAHEPSGNSSDPKKAIVKYLNGIPIVSNMAAKFVGLISDDKKSGDKILLETRLQELRSQLLNYVHSNERSLEAHPKGQSLLDESDELADTLDIIQTNIEKGEIEPARQLLEKTTMIYKSWKKNAEAVLKYNSGKQGF